MSGANYIHAASAANALADSISALPSHELMRLEHSIEPLLRLMRSNSLDDPVTIKATLSIRNLISSRLCLASFIEKGGMFVLSSLLETALLTKRTNLKKPSAARNVCEDIAVICREVSRFYPWKIVENNIIPHMVTMLKQGDITFQSIAATSFAAISQDDEIAKLLFTNGCVKPILSIADADETNEACMMSGLGCLVQLCKVPEIALLILEQGALKIFEKSLNRTSGRFAQSLREKAMYAISMLCRMPPCRPILGSPGILQALKRELLEGTPSAKDTALAMILAMHNYYDNELAYVMEIREIILNFLLQGAWHVRNMAAKCICVLYRQPHSQMYFIENGAFDALTDVITTKSKELQEAPMVAILSLLSHPDAHEIMWNKRRCIDAVMSLIGCSDTIIHELAVVFVKVMSIYDWQRIDAMIPSRCRFHFNLGDDMPELIGAEYGGMVQEFLQKVVDNRRENDYLLDGVDMEKFRKIGLDREKLQPYLDNFMELDPKCRGVLDIDGLKLVLIDLGEEVDEEVLMEVFCKYDIDSSGTMSFMEYVLLMEDYKGTNAGSFVRKFKHSMNRGRIGRARRFLKKWWNQEEIVREEVAAARRRWVFAKQEKKELAKTHWESEKLQLKRDAIAQSRKLERLNSKPIQDEEQS
jgi:hypothetical protein